MKRRRTRMRMQRAATSPIVTPASAPDGFVRMFVGHGVTPRHDDDASPRIAAAVVFDVVSRGRRMAGGHRHARR